MYVDVKTLQINAKLFLKTTKEKKNRGEEVRRKRKKSEETQLGTHLSDFTAAIPYALAQRRVA